MSENIINKLEEFIGAEKVYQGKNIIIKSFKNVNGTIVIITNSRTLTFFPDQLSEFINSLQETPKPKQQFLPKK